MSCSAALSCAELLFRLLGIGLTNGAVIALNAIAVTLVYGAVRMINFAYGDVFALATVVITSIVIRLGLQPNMPPLWIAGGLLLALVAAAGFALLLNVAIERLAFRPFRDTSRLAPLIAGIGISFVLYQVALLWRMTESSWIPGEHRSVPGIPEVPRGAIPDLIPNIKLVQAIGIATRAPYTLKDLLVVALAFALALGVTWFLRATRAGRALRACSQDPEMAQLCGVDRNRTIQLAFALGGLLAGASAFIYVAYYNHPYSFFGAQSGLTAFAAAMLGGIGAPIGAFFGGMVFGIFTAFSDYFLAARWTPVLLLSILIALLVLKPGGLAGADGDESRIEVVAGYSRVGDRSAWWRTIALLAVAALYPLIDQMLGLRQQVIVTSVLIFAVLALGLNVLIGFAGLLDLGYAACFAIGGYTAALMIDVGGPLRQQFPGVPSFLLVLLVSALVAAAFGVLNGLLTLRLRGDVLAIATLAFGQLIPRIFLNLDSVTRGARGLSALPPPQLFGFTLNTALERYYLVFALLTLVVLISFRLSDSRIGRAWRALSEDEAAAASSGVSPVRSRLLAFTIGTAVAGIAGATFASVFSYVDPDQSDFRVSAMVLAMVVIGGAGSVPGMLIGALLVAGYDLLLIPQVGAWLANLQGGQPLLDIRGLSYMAFGLALYLTVLLRARRAR